MFRFLRRDNAVSRAATVATLLATPLLSSAARAGDDDGASTKDKSAYTLFNPTPDDALRPLNADRPTKITGPFTVDAGRVQIESDFLSYTHSNDGAGGTRYFTTLDPEFKLGVTNWMDIELNVFGYNQFTTHDNATGALTANGHGFGDMFIKTKINLVGNDTGDFALALLPYVKAPTATPAIGNRRVEGGLLIPAQLKAPGDFVLQVMTEVDALKRMNDSKRYANFINIVALSHDLAPISKDLTVSVEFFSDVGTDPATKPVYTFDLGLAYLVDKSFQIDGGANFGLNKAAPNLTLYAGVAKRF